MTSMDRAVCAALEGVCGEVIFGYPKDLTADNFLCWRGSQNRCYARADGLEHLTELEYTLDAYAPAAGEAWALLEKSDARMQSIGFRRQSATEIWEQDSSLCRVNARYRALTDGKGNVYQ